MQQYAIKTYLLLTSSTQHCPRNTAEECFKDPKRILLSAALDALSYCVVDGSEL